MTCSTNLRSMDLNLLAIFEAIIEERNVTRAAKRLGMSQPAMSNSLNRLRVSFDNPLFLHDGRTMRPTNLAIEIAPNVHEALALIRNSIEMTKQFVLDEPHFFTIASVDYIDILVLSKIISSISNDSDNIVINSTSVCTEDAIKSLRYGDVDFIIDFKPTEDEDLVVEPLFQETPITVCSKSNEICGDDITLEEYLEAKHIVSPRSNRISEIDNSLASIGKKRKTGMTVSSYFAMAMITADTNMISTMHKRLGEYFCNLFPLRTTNVPFPVKPVTFYMMWHRHHTNEPSHIWLRNKIRALCKNI
jgi:DNA-binding transcriptional LysR family regulator